jgi:hypothetical protein
MRHIVIGFLVLVLSVMYEIALRLIVGIRTQRLTGKVDSSLYA